jgi:hypothetical protein
MPISPMPFTPIGFDGTVFFRNHNNMNLANVGVHGDHVVGETRFELT